MSEKTTENVVLPEPKPRLIDRLKASNIPAKAKNIAAVVGVVTVIGVAAAAIAKARANDVEDVLDADLTKIDV